MLIDLTKINNEAVILDNSIVIEEKYYKNSPIISIKNGYLTGKIYNDYGEITFDGYMSGTMILNDTITLEPIEHSFSFEIEEVIEENSEYFNKIQNTLDIMPILWQNIVLEVPMRITNSETFDNLKGEGWELKNNCATEIDPRLSVLTEVYGKEEGE